MDINHDPVAISRIVPCWSIPHSSPDCVPGDSFVEKWRRNAGRRLSRPVCSPIATVILLHSVLYDGWRHMYFIYPAFLLLAIRGWVSLRGDDLVWTFRRSLLGVVTVISIVHTAVWMWKAHPFQNVYFNTFAGTGLRSRYELDYWGLANRKALEYILKSDHSEVINVRADSFTPLSLTFDMIDARDKNRLRYSHDRNLSRYVITNYRLVTDPDDAKYAKDYDLFYQIRVDDEAILSVFRRKGT
jgi:hypothetical protein